MRQKENYTRYVVVALILTLAVLASFQIYIFGEPGRIAAVEATDKAVAVSAGHALFEKNCTLCHGNDGEGDIGPALNDKKFLDNTPDDQIFSIVSSGVPNTQMPSWNQSHGGPLTDEEVTQLVAFVRAWQPQAPDRSLQPLTGDYSRGQSIFNNVCAICHGTNGVGSDRAPALNDVAKLSQFDDAWYKSTIQQGRPDKGMPTWGTVLSPQQIADVLTVIDKWRANPAAAITPSPVPTSTTATTTTVEVARPSNPGDAGPAVKLTGDATSGAQIFAADCQKCHGDKGTGSVQNPGSDDGTVPPLNPIDSSLISSDPSIYAYNLDLFLEHGSTPAGPNPQLKMPAWGDEKKLTPQQIADVIAYVESLNPAPPPTPEAARPSNPGDVGPAVSLTGDATSGGQIYVTNCQKCHGDKGVGGVANPGSDDGTVPPLNPIDNTLISSDPHTYAYNLDLFLEHGSTPAGTNPQLKMPAWGDDKKLTPQQIADVIAYVESLNPAPAPTPEAARPSNPGDAGPAVSLTGNATSGAQIFVTNCQKCHGDKGVGGVANPGSDDGTVPPLNPIDGTLISSDPHTYIYNLDLFLEHGSTPAGPNPQLKMPAWGDDKKLTPQQIADVIAYVTSLNPAPAVTPAPAPTETSVTTPTVEAARPSNPGGPGTAIGLTGDPQSGTQLFVTNCQKCHGPTGTGGVANPGSDDGTVPPLNPIDSTLIDSDAKVYATNLDLFLEHGSTPAGANPQLKMPAWGDDKKLTPQQIADLIAYVMSLNPAPVRPSNAGDAGPALKLTGSATSGQQVYVTNCQKCHGDKGVGGVANPGSDDGTVPPLNPIDSTLVNADPAVFAYNLDLFVEHGSTPAGPNPQQKMPAWGDDAKLTPQQIADVIAYVMSLNTK